MGTRKKRFSLEHRFWEKVDKTSSCWLWKAAKNQYGYGVFGTINPRLELAHRVSWRLAGFEVPRGLCVLHRCDVPACVRPDHLFVGTKAENSRDMVKKGRNVTPAKITREVALRIRNAGGLHREIAERFGVSRTCVTRIKNNQSWC